MKIVTKSEVPGISFTRHTNYAKSLHRHKKIPSCCSTNTNPTIVPRMIGVKILSYNLDLLNLSLKGNP